MDCRRKQDPTSYTTDRWRGSGLASLLGLSRDDKHSLHTCIFISEASCTLLSYKPTVSPLSTNVFAALHVPFSKFPFNSPVFKQGVGVSKPNKRC